MLLIISIAFPLETLPDSCGEAVVRLSQLAVELILVCSCCYRSAPMAGSQVQKGPPVIELY